MRKSAIWILVLILLLSTAIAEPPFQESGTSADEITIIYPKNDFFIYEQNFSLHYHAYNSTGFLLTNETTVCHIHIYNETGNHVYEEDMAWDSNNIDFYQKIDSAKFTHVGEYGYLVHCNNTQEAGFVSGSILIAQGSPMVDSGDSGWILAAIIMTPLLFAIVLMISAATLDEEHHGVLRIFLFLLSFTSFFISMLFGLISVSRYLDFQVMQDRIGVIVFVFGLLFFVILSYFLIYAFVMAVNTAAQKRNERLRY